jgi:hypothetical protein
MGSYLVVANQTAISEELIQGLRDKVQEDRSAEFFLLVPATPSEHLLTQEGGSPRQIAARRAGRALTALTDAGLPIVGAQVGAATPREAIETEMHQRPGLYDGIIICTLPEGLSRWLDADLPYRLEQIFRRPVTHIVMETRRPRS